MPEVTSPNWKYKISIKEQFEDETTSELIDKLCTSLVSQLTKIKEGLHKSNIKENSLDLIADDLENVIDNFAFLKKIADGSIPESDWHNYGVYDSDFEELFNDYLEQLYDLGDLRVPTKSNTSEKFIWIG